MIKWWCEWCFSPVEWGVPDFKQTQTCQSKHGTWGMLLPPSLGIPQLMGICKSSHFLWQDKPCFEHGTNQAVIKLIFLGDGISNLIPPKKCTYPPKSPGSVFFICGMERILTPLRWASRHCSGPRRRPLPPLRGLSPSSPLLWWPQPPPPWWHSVSCRWFPFWSRRSSFRMPKGETGLPSGNGWFFWGGFWLDHVGGGCFTWKRKPWDLRVPHKEGQLQPRCICPRQELCKLLVGLFLQFLRILVSVILSMM